MTRTHAAWSLLFLLLILSCGLVGFCDDSQVALPDSSGSGQDPAQVESTTILDVIETLRECLVPSDLSSPPESSLLSCQKPSRNGPEREGGRLHVIVLSLDCQRDLDSSYITPVRKYTSSLSAESFHRENFWVVWLLSSERCLVSLLSFEEKQEAHSVLVILPPSAQSSQRILSLQQREPSTSEDVILAGTAREDLVDLLERKYTAYVRNHASDESGAKDAAARCLKECEASTKSETATPSQEEPPPNSLGECQTEVSSLSTQSTSMSSTPSAQSDASLPSALIAVQSESAARRPPSLRSGTGHAAARLVTTQLPSGTTELYTTTMTDCTWTWPSSQEESTKAHTTTVEPSASSTTTVSTGTPTSRPTSTSYIWTPPKTHQKSTARGASLDMGLLIGSASGGVAAVAAAIGGGYKAYRFLRFSEEVAAIDSEADVAARYAYEYETSFGLQSV